MAVAAVVTDRGGTRGVRGGRGGSFPPRGALQAAAHSSNFLSTAVPGTGNVYKSGVTKKVNHCGRRYDDVCSLVTRPKGPLTRLVELRRDEAPSQGEAAAGGGGLGGDRDGHAAPGPGGPGGGPGGGAALLLLLLHRGGRRPPRVHFFHVAGGGPGVAPEEGQDGRRRGAGPGGRRRRRGSSPGARGGRRRPLWASAAGLDGGRPRRSGGGWERASGAPSTPLRGSLLFLGRSRGRPLAPDPVGVTPEALAEAVALLGGHVVVVVRVTPGAPKREMPRRRKDEARSCSALKAEADKARSSSRNGGEKRGGDI